MKHCLVTLTALLVAASSFAQGTVNFVNRIPGTLDAKVLYNGAGALGGGTTPETQFVAQLYQGAAAIGAPIPFRSSAAQGGYWVAESRTIPASGIDAAGVAANLKTVAFSTGLGATLDDVKAKGMGGWGESPAYSANPGQGLNPPANLTGMQGFTIAEIIIPEPSVAALGLLGAGLLLIRRKK
jgi:hypothetical protein